jgi:hypothetical protein
MRASCGLLDGKIPATYIITGYDMSPDWTDHTLEFLLAFDGRVHHLEEGY